MSAPRILFVNPRYGGQDGLIILPLDQASAAAYALAQGVDAEVLDLAFEKDDAKLEAKLLARDFDLVVLTAITICFRTAVDAAKLVKQLKPTLTVAIMGEHVTYRREESLERHDCLDFVISFESEITSIELAKAMIAQREGQAIDLSELNGITYRKKLLPAAKRALPIHGASQHFVRNPDRQPIEDLDILPPPAKHLYDLKGYLDRDHETTMITTRGCTHRCSFCHRWRYGRRLRNWSLPRVMQEIDQNLRDGYTAIFFQDDVFCYDKERVREFCQMLIDRKVDIEWNCNVRIDDFDPANPEHGALAALMRKAGCYRIFVGIEAFDQELLDRSKKLAQVTLIRGFIEFWQERGVQVHASYIVGLPGDSEHKIHRRVELAVELGTDLASFNRIFPHPGTPYGDEPEKYGISVPDKHWYEKTDWWTAAVAGNDDLTPADVYGLQQWALAHYTEAYMDQG